MIVSFDFSTHSQVMHGNDYGCGCSHRNRTGDGWGVPDVGNSAWGDGCLGSTPGTMRGDGFGIDQDLVLNAIIAGDGATINCGGKLQSAPANLDNAMHSI